MSRAEDIRNLRKAGLTVREIATRVGVSHQYVARLTKEQPPPTFHVWIDSEGRTVVQGDLDPKYLATHVVYALRRSADVVYNPAQDGTDT